MINILKKIEREQILNILSQPIEKFKTLYVDYEHPYVERLQYNLEDGYRLFFHVIHTCKTEEALYHPHPWPSAMHILEGKYETGVSYSEVEEHYKHTETGELNELIAKSEVAKFVIGSDLYNYNIAYYQMLNPKGWHYVRPLQTCYTTMLTHTPWYSGNKPTKKLEALSEERTISIINKFKYMYSILNLSSLTKQ